MKTLRCLVGMVLVPPLCGQVPATAFVNFEARQTHPVRLSADGKLLFAVNSADARLSIFNVTQTPPILANEIPVGIEPVSVNPRTTDEVWVVNELSDSVSIISVSRGIVTDTIHVKDEPSDVVFAGSYAFVSVSGNNEVRVFNAVTHALAATIPLTGQRPRAMAVSADGSKVYVAFAESGNRTTLIPVPLAPPQSPPTNPSLPPPPQVSLIVDATDPQWNPSVINYIMPDNDVAEINTNSLTVSRYFSRVGTSNLGIAVQPMTGDVFVANTDARNLVHFEPNLRAHFVDNRLTRIGIVNGAKTIFDLNPGINYAVLPNPSAQAIALAQPSALVFEPTGAFSYVAAFGSDRIARVQADGTISSRIELGGTGANSRSKRGPRGLALDSAAGKLYVLNRISNTLGIIDTTTQSMISEVPVGKFDPTPTVIRSGRGFLYDARLSGNGTVSCASCHLDGTHDRLAWDLGDPGGQMEMATALISGTNITGTFQMHPMKGPMTTQTLKGLKNLAPLHWRGDRATFNNFNGAFDSLMGGPLLSPADMEAYKQFVETMTLPPNPHQRLDGTLPNSLPFTPGDPVAGRNTYLNEFYTAGLSCNTCHSANPGPGTNKSITPAQALQESQSFKVPQLRNMYEKISFTTTPGAVSLDGFGFTHDGTDPTLFRFLSRPVFGNFSNDVTRKNNLGAFLMCFDPGIAPAVGYTRTITGLNLNDAVTTADWTLLQTQAAAGKLELIVKGTINGERHGLVYQPGPGNYKTDKTGLGPFTRAELQAKIQAGDTLSITGVPPGSGVRMGIDRDLNGEPDGDGPPFNTYAQWRAYWFTPAEAGNTAISGPLVDLEHDGRKNALEYALNSNPKKAEPNGDITIRIQGGSLVLNHTKIIAATDLDYLIEQSPDLLDWSPANATNEILADDGRLQIIGASIPTNTAAKFMRLSATLR